MLRADPGQRGVARRPWSGVFRFRTIRRVSSLIIPERLAELDEVRISPRESNPTPHASSRSDGFGSLELITWLTGQEPADASDHVSGTLQWIVRSIDVAWGWGWPRADGALQELKPLLVDMIGTANDGKEEARGFLALDWLVRTFMPHWLTEARVWEARGLAEKIAPIVDAASAQAAMESVCAAALRARLLRQEVTADAAGDGGNAPRERPARLPRFYPGTPHDPYVRWSGDPARPLRAFTLTLGEMTPMAEWAVDQSGANPAATAAALSVTGESMAWVDLAIAAAEDAAAVIALRAVGLDESSENRVRTTNVGPVTVTERDHVRAVMHNDLQRTTTLLQRSLLERVRAMIDPDPEAFHARAARWREDYEIFDRGVDPYALRPDPRD